MVPIDSMVLRTAISKYVKTISRGKDNVNILSETKNLLTAFGKKYVMLADDCILQYKGDGRKALNIIDYPFCPSTILSAASKVGDDINYQIYSNGNIVDNVLCKNGSITEEAEQVLFNILA